MPEVVNPLCINLPQYYTAWCTEDSDPVSLGRDVTFTFGNLPDTGLSNSFTPKEKGQKSTALQGDGRNSRDSDLPDNGDPDDSDFNNNNKVNDYLDNIDKQVLTQDIITTISALANTMKHYKHS